MLQGQPVLGESCNQHRLTSPESQDSVRGPFCTQKTISLGTVQGRGWGGLGTLKYRVRTLNADSQLKGVMAG